MVKNIKDVLWVALNTILTVITGGLWLVVMLLILYVRDEV